MIGRLLSLPLWRPLRDRTFRRLFLGEGLALLADHAFFIALTLLVLEVAGPGAALGAVLAVASVPGAALMVVGGWVSDRFPPAAVLVVSNAGRSALLAVLAALVLSDAARIPHLYVLAGALGVLDAFHFPAALSVVPSVVEEEDLGAANALIQGAEQTGMVAGPALAAAASASLGLGTTFGVLALMFLATSAVALSVARSASGGARGGSKGREPAAEPQGRSLAGDIAEGMSYAWRDPPIRAMLFLLAAINLAAVGPVVVGGAVLAEARLGGAGYLGVLFSVFGVASLVGLLLAGSAGRPRRRGATMLGTTALFGLGLGSLGFAPGLLAASASSAVAGLGSGYLGVVLVSWLQERAEPALRGRVMSLVVFCSVAFDAVSYALAGALVRRASPSPSRRPGRWCSPPPCS